MTRHPAWELLDKLEMDANAMLAKVKSLRIQFAAIDLPSSPEPLRCECGWTGQSRVKFQEHRYRQHNGAVPEHYLAAERAAGHPA